MKRTAFTQWTSAAILSLFLTGCAVQAPHVKEKEAEHSLAVQRASQQVLTAAPPTKLVLKRKVALGRITNETNYGRSLLRDQQADPLGKQISDLVSKALTESGSYLVFERPDITRLQAEARLTGDAQSLIGVDSLLIGSLTEFGRKTVGATGFVSASKRQVAFAKVDLRVVEVSTGQVIFATSGAGEASTETASIFGFGSQAAYDGTLNDAAIRQAVGDAIAKLTTALEARPWNTAVLKVESGRVFISGGKSQGIKQGMQFTVFTRGEQIKSPQTGALITLPGRAVATLQVENLFGSNYLDEGAMATVLTGSLASYPAEQLIVHFGDGK